MSTAYKDKLVSLGFQSYWKFDGANHAAGVADSIGSVTGTWLTDPSVFQQEALVYSDPTSKQPNFRNAVSSGADMGNVYDFPGTQVFTVTFWMKLVAYNPGSGHVLLSNAGSGVDGWYIDITSGGISFYRGDAAGFDQTGYLTDAIKSLPGTLLMIGCVYDGSFLNIYANGILKNQQATSKTSTASATRPNLNIGQAEGGGSGFDGPLGHVAIGNIAVNATDMATLYASAFNDSAMVGTFSPLLNPVGMF